MPNVYTGLSAGTAATNGSLGGGQYSGSGNTGTFTPSNGAGLVQKAYDRLVEFALRAQPLLRSVADKRPARQAMPGSTVTLQLYSDMAQKTTTLNETEDPDSIGLATPTKVDITLEEYGNAALVTRKLQLFSLADVDPAIANIIAFNMADSVDELAQTALRQGTNVIRPDTSGATKTLAYNSGTVADIDSDDIITAAAVRMAVAKLRANKAVPRKGSMYWAAVHPEVSLDLRAETGAASWRDPHVYQSNNEIWAGEIGAFEGAYFVESPRLFSALDGKAATAAAVTAAFSATTGAVYTLNSHGFLVGDWIQIAGFTGGATVHNGIWQITAKDTNTFTIGADKDTTASAGSPTAALKTKVYRSYIAGQQALAEAVAEEPHVVIGPVVDKLMRFRPIGWYGVLGFARYREDALIRIESASSIATVTSFA